VQAQIQGAPSLFKNGRFFVLSNECFKIVFDKKGKIIERKKVCSLSPSLSLSHYWKLTICRPQQRLFLFTDVVVFTKPLREGADLQRSVSSSSAKADASEAIESVLSPAKNWKGRNSMSFKEAVVRKNIKAVGVPVAPELADCIQIQLPDKVVVIQLPSHQILYRWYKKRKKRKKKVKLSCPLQTNRLVELNGTIPADLAKECGKTVMTSSNNLLGGLNGPSTPSNVPNLLQKASGTALFGAADLEI